MTEPLTATPVSLRAVDTPAWQLPPPRRPVTSFRKNRAPKPQPFLVLARITTANICAVHLSGSNCCAA
jgi:hypothetical protein